jgi:hypothetical protein
MVIAPRVVAEYKYLDRDGSLLYVTERRDPKDFRQRKPGPDGSWIWSLTNVPRVPYRLPELRKAIEAGRTIFVTEGEKDADALIKLGFVATTNAGGAGWNWTPPFVEHFFGAKRIAIVADCDPPGRGAARARAQLLLELSNDVRVVELAPDREDGFDVSDWLAEDHSREDMRAIVEAAPIVERELRRRPAASAPPIGNPERRLNFVDWNTVAIERIYWLLIDRMPFGEFISVEGDGGIGKTTSMLDIVARLSAGRPMPDGTTHSPANVIVIAEEDRRSILKARLIAAGAELSRIHLVSSVDEDEHFFTLPTDARALLAAVTRIGARAVVVDALFNHFDDDINAHKAQDVRRALRPLIEVAHESGAAITGIRHWAKTRGSAAERGMGSIDMRNLARSVISVAPHPSEEGRYVAAVSKSNLGSPTNALSYRLVSTTVTGDGESVDVAKVEWGDEVAISANELANVSLPTAEEGAKIDVAGEWVHDFLSAGPRPSAEVYEAGLAADIPRATLARAATRIGVRKERSGFPSRSTWSLKSQSTHSAPKHPDSELTETSEPTALDASRLSPLNLSHSTHKSVMSARARARESETTGFDGDRL